MPSWVPSWPKAAGVDAYVRYGAVTGGLVATTCAEVTVPGTAAAQWYAAEAVSVAVSNSCVGDGTTTWKAACAAPPAATVGNEVADAGATDQPAGAASPMWTSWAGRTPLSANETVTVAG